MYWILTPSSRIQEGSEEDLRGGCRGDQLEQTAQLDGALESRGAFMRGGHCVLSRLGGHQQREYVTNRPAPGTSTGSWSPRCTLCVFLARLWLTKELARLQRAEDGKGRVR